MKLCFCFTIFTYQKFFHKFVLLKKLLSVNRNVVPTKDILFIASLPDIAGSF